MPRDQASTATAEEGAGEAVTLLSRVRRALPRPETAVLAMCVVGVIGAKYAVRPPLTEDVAGQMVPAALAEIVFFAAISALFALAAALRPSPLVARLSLIIAVLAATWATLNAAWIMSTSAQLQPSVLRLAAHDLRETSLIIRQTLAAALNRIWLPGLFVLAIAGWIGCRLVRPRPLAPERGRHLRHAVIAIGLAVTAALGLQLVPRSASLTTWGDAMGFNSHWYAMAQLVRDLGGPHAAEQTSRVVPRVGTRVVTPPDPAAARPNVVIIWLESVSYPSSSLGTPALGTTPTLERIAAEGVEFVTTRAIMPETTKAWWTTLTSTHPDLQEGAVESVLVDEPYESLATILRRVGHRSAFFEMSRGPWLGAPGLFANTGFDFAWFRENLEDPSAYLGWVNGDDFRMIEPMFEWVDAGDGPFLLTTITSVAHDPYELPEWYEHERKDTPYENYLQTVEFSDAFVAEVCRQLETRGLLDDTIVCVMGDHGETFRPEAKRGRWVVFEELVRVPWVMRWPGHLEAGRKIEWPCSQLDVTPTILTLLGFGVADAGFEGVDALQPVDPERRLFFASWYGNSPKGYTEGDRKYIYIPYTDTLFLYDLAADPQEQHPAPVDGPEKAAIVDRIEAWQRDSFITFHPRRYRERLLFDHWRVFSSGRTTNAYYLP